MINKISRLQDRVLFLSQLPDIQIGALLRQIISSTA